MEGMGIKFGVTLLVIGYVSSAVVDRSSSGGGKGGVTCGSEVDLAQILEVDLQFYNRLHRLSDLDLDARYADAGLMDGVIVEGRVDLTVGEALASLCTDLEDGLAIKYGVQLLAKNFSIRFDRFDNKFRRPMWTDGTGHVKHNLTVHFTQISQWINKWRTLPWGYTDTRTRTTAEASWSQEGGRRCGGFTEFGRFMMSHLMQRAFPISVPTAGWQSPLLMGNLLRASLDVNLAKHRN